MSNVFETEEKRREIQKEIERAQQLLADAHEVGESGEVPSKPDEEFNEGEELQKVGYFVQFLTWKIVQLFLNLEIVTVEPLFRTPLWDQGKCLLNRGKR